jgi:hypothetical protein
MHVISAARGDAGERRVDGDAAKRSRSGDAVSESSGEDAAADQGPELVHFFAHPEPISSLKPAKHHTAWDKKCSR